MINIQDSKLISSHYLVRHDSGVIELILNVQHKSFSVHQSNDTTYIIDEYDIVSIPEVEDLFDKENHIVYHRSDSCCKDQHIFLWIPISLLGKSKLQDKHTLSQKSKL